MKEVNVEVAARTAPGSGVLRTQAAEGLVSASTRVRLLGDMLRAALAGVAVLYIIAYLVAALLRMRYPFEIGFMDGNFLVQLERVLRGEPMFVAPALAYTPMVYEPLYFYAAALLAKLAGGGMTSLRLVSFLATMGTFPLLYLFVRRETSSRYCGLVSVGLFAATYRETSYGLDGVGTNPLYLFLLVCAAYLLRWRSGPAWWALAGCFAGISFLTKQTALIMILPLAVYTLTQERRSFLAFTGMAAGIGGGGVALMHLLSGGWSTLYLFSVVSTVFTAWRPFLQFWPRDVFLVLPIAALFCAMYFLDSAAWEDRRRAWFYWCFGAGMIGAAWLYMLNWGGGAGGRVPAYFFLCLVAGLGLGRTFAAFSASPSERSATWKNVLFAALAIQFCALLYNPLPVIPGKADVEAGEQVVARIASIPGPVYVPYHPYLPVLAGKPAFSDMMNLRFVMRAPDQRAVEPLRAELHEAFQQKKFAAVITDADWTHEILDEEFRDDLLANYVKSEEIPYTDNSVFRITGSVMEVRPQFVYLPKPQAAK